MTRIERLDVAWLGVCCCAIGGMAGAWFWMAGGSLWFVPAAGVLLGIIGAAAGLVLQWLGRCVDSMCAVMQRKR